MKEYMTRRRRNNEFRNKQNRALHAKRLKKSNPQYVQEVNKNAQNRKRSLMSWLNPWDSQPLKDQVV